MEDNMDIYSVKVSLQKCGINSSSGFKNIFGRETLQKSILFPVIRVKYRNPDENEPNKISKTFNIERACLTEKNWAGACCGVNWFLVSNTSGYTLYDKKGTYIKRLIVKEVGEIVRVGDSCFFTQSSEGIVRLWLSDGSLKEEYKLTPEQMEADKKSRILRKGEYISVKITSN